MFTNKHRRLVSIESKKSGKNIYDRSKSVNVVNLVKVAELDSQNQKGQLKPNCFLKAVKHKVGRSNKDKQNNDPYQMARKKIIPPPCSKMEGPLRSLDDDDDDEEPYTKPDIIVPKTKNMQNAEIQ